MSRGLPEGGPGPSALPLRGGPVHSAPLVSALSPELYRSRPGRTVRGPEVVYEQVGEPVFCCEEMRRNWGVMAGFAVRSAPRSTSKEINLWNRLPQASGFRTWALVEIHFCPFCGEAVEACRVKSLDS